MRNYILARLKEPSTWAALFTFGSVFFGLDLTPDEQYAISGLAIALFVTKA